MQATLKANRRRLKAASIRFQKMHKVPDFWELAQRFRRAAEQNDEARLVSLLGLMRRSYAELVRKYAAFDSLLLSFEGHLGSMAFNRSKGLYPAHAVITSHLRDMFPGNAVAVGLSIRSYDEFIESTYKYLVRNGSGLSFETYVSNIDFATISWVPIVDDLVAKFGAGNVYVWSFHAYISDFRGFFAWLLRAVGGKEFPRRIKVDKSSENASSSRAALQLSVQTNRRMKRLLTDRALRKKVIKAVNKTAEEVFDTASFGRPALLPPDVKAELRARFAADLERIRALVPDTSFLDVKVEIPKVAKKRPLGARVMGTVRRLAGSSPRRPAPAAQRAR